MKPDWVDEFVAWHEQRLRELGYPRDICEEFRQSRRQFLASAAKRIKR